MSVWITGPTTLCVRSDEAIVDFCQLPKNAFIRADSSVNYQQQIIKYIHQFLSLGIETYRTCYDSARKFICKNYVQVCSANKTNFILHDVQGLCPMLHSCANQSNIGLLKEFVTQCHKQPNGTFSIGSCVPYHQSGFNNPYCDPFPKGITFPSYHLDNFIAFNFTSLLLLRLISGSGASRPCYALWKRILCYPMSFCSSNQENILYAATYQQCQIGLSW